MRLNINLASQPYEVAREYKRRITMLIAALGLVAAVLVGYIVYQRAHSRTVNRQLTEVQQQIGGLDREEDQARAILNKPTNRAIADQSDFLNELFARKAMSWTHIFTEMEKIMPPSLHVVSIKPEYTKTNDLVLHMVVATDSRDRAVELMRHMEKSNHFRQAQVESETVVTGTSDQGGSASGNIQFDIAAIYVPGTADTDEPADAGDGKATPEAQPGPPAKKAATAPAVNAAPATLNSAATPAPSPVGNVNLNAAQNRPMAPERLRSH